MFERRILLGCTVLVGLSVCIWAIAIGTDHWFTVEAPDETGLPLGDAGKAGRRLIYKHMGLWRGCIRGVAPESVNSTVMVPYSKWIKFRKTYYLRLRRFNAKFRGISGGIVSRLTGTFVRENALSQLTVSNE